MGLLSLISVGRHYSGEPIRTGGQHCRAGQRWQWDGVNFTVLWPSSTFLIEHGGQAKSNNLSCVLLVERGDYRFLLAGDIDKSIEKKLLAQYPNKLKNITAILVPHHGSRTSSHQAWVDHLSVQYAIVTAGYNNAYRHPHQRVVERYQQQGATLKNTGSSGAIRLEVTPRGALTLTPWREYRKRYWYEGLATREK